jgi:ATP-dependent Clp protease ATP-binding subunit ClpC
MFERFTDRARRTVVMAQEEARILDHNYIGTEHLLLGLIHERTGVAAKALASLGIDLEAARQQVEEIIGRGQQPPSGHIPFTARAKKVLELAPHEADALGDGQINTEHLLLGLLREGDGVAVRVLVSLGTDLNRVRDRVMQLVPGRGGSHVADEGSRLSDDAFARIDALGSRLAAIERWLGMRPDLDNLENEIAQVRGEKEAAINRQEFETAAALREKEKLLMSRRDSREKEWDKTAADRPALTGEIARLDAQLARLRAILRQHGIEPGDDAA